MPFVRIDDKQLASEYGFDTDIPVLVYFEKRIPSVFKVNIQLSFQDSADLTNEQQVWKWLHLQLTSDGIEEVTEKFSSTWLLIMTLLLFYFTTTNQKKEC
ncbi:uncharacterized protein CEXT_526471 [Caerostris extrusa]|uniref:Uncharacterized protein n=1 Tax=Caerostris extrusa TaxID=172846 RepID=A0AAV4Q0F8_CAEEX|nr:uncharacterized protein CEXT_526471 [Caerostris extrusa]